MVVRKPVQKSPRDKKVAELNPKERATFQATGELARMQEQERLDSEAREKRIRNFGVTREKSIASGKLSKDSIGLGSSDREFLQERVDKGTLLDKELAKAAGIEKSIAPSTPKPTLTEQILKQSLPADLRNLTPEEIKANQSLLGGQSRPTDEIIQAPIPEEDIINAPGTTILPAPKPERPLPSAPTLQIGQEGLGIFGSTPEERQRLGEIISTTQTPGGPQSINAPIPADLLRTSLEQGAKSALEISLIALPASYGIKAAKFASRARKLGYNNRETAALAKELTRIQRRVQEAKAVLKAHGFSSTKRLQGSLLKAETEAVNRFIGGKGTIYGRMLQSPRAAALVKASLIGVGLTAAAASILSTYVLGAWGNAEAPEPVLIGMRDALNEGDLETYWAGRQAYDEIMDKNALEEFMSNTPILTGIEGSNSKAFGVMEGLEILDRRFANKLLETNNDRLRFD